ncbi:hypothetical protein [Paenarthrobacter nitroguajacolicus]|uniref:hypothetical protein n=1 Tax=Paenarthrobacter nitroguajacolicus TaxID=211146 RepID=UPI0040539E97
MTEPQHSESEHSELENYELERLEAERPAIQWPDVVDPTGDPLVDKALGVLHDVAGSPVPNHGELYGSIHDALLEALDAEPGVPAAPKSSSSVPRPEGDS